MSLAQWLASSACGLELDLPMSMGLVAAWDLELELNRQPMSTVAEVACLLEASCTTPAGIRAYQTSLRLAQQSTAKETKA